ncbi:Na+/H+ antiporter NhaC family protein [Alkalimonas collagenimarina]|uniref:Na+/H+ antiporter NhaC family protein n=1 Tax=Alkalimonas collagenimarina TaxID=400390 RepID=A0ABT9H3J7_9GAMM|nr:Na+/H+ antiporter NhaC family protein [Alkalimonas collagenimarina]MDP4537889.1 Na+/H+ antiporter NhaC family protein [Alkalimonas collagenimarina]
MSMETTAEAIEEVVDPLAAALEAAVVEPSAISLIPPIVVLIIAIWLKRPIFALLMGAIAGLLLISPRDTLFTFAETTERVMLDETIGWLILVVGGFGALIALLVHTGGAFAFGRVAQQYAKGRKPSLLMTYFLGMLIFIDDYLNALTVGETMKRITDKFKVSREMLAYVVDSTAAPMCVIVPISTWAVFFGGLLVANGVAPDTDPNGIRTYISAIPYMLYAWLAMLMVPLVILGVVPLLGPMKKAELAARGGAVQQDAPQQDTHTGDDFAMQAMEEEFDHADRKHGKLINFILPMVMLVGFTIWFEAEIWPALILTFVLTLPFYMAQRLMPFNEMMDQMMHGFKTMLPAICTVIAAFTFKDVCDQLGLPLYVIDNLAPYMNAQMLPALVFVAMALLAFATGSSWGIFAVSIPIVMPIALAVDANIPLVIGALLSASSFGSQACFYSDSTVLAAQGSGCDLMSHALTQFPYALIAAILAFFGFIALGMV